MTKTNALLKYIQELQEYEIASEEDQMFNNMVPIQDAIDILEKFEVELIDELTCEQLEQLKLKEWI